jgi:signal transduction histidine kinase
MAEPRIGVFCCSLLGADVRRALDALSLGDVPLAMLPSMCHVHSQDPAATSEALAGLQAETDHVVTLCMNCVRRSDQSTMNGGRVGALPDEGLSRIRVQTQGELFLGRDATDHELRRGAFLVLPAWLAHWRQIVTDKWGFDAETARDFFGETITRLVFLDTGQPGPWAELLVEMAGFTGAAAETRVVGTAHLEALLGRAIEHARATLTTTRLQAEIARSRENAANHAALVDFVTALGDLLAEDDVARRLEETCAALFAPQRARFVPAPPDRGHDEPTVAHAPEPSPAPNCEATPSADGTSLQVDVRHRGVTLGTLHLDGLAFPQYLDRYTPMARLIANAAALALSAARLHLRERELVAELREKVRELDAFVYVASHDLQEPLRTLNIFSEMLEHDGGGALSEDALRDVRFIRDAATRMRALVLALLDLSRAGRRELKVGPVDLEACVDAAIANLKVAFEESGAALERDLLPEVVGDPSLLVQLFQNLLGNALKFRGPDRPEIRVTIEKAEGGPVFGVRDNGIGLDPRYAQIVFEPFKRLYSASKYPGSGIGLSVCHTIVQRHGGRIWVESQPGKGAHFRFTLGALPAPRLAGKSA